MSTDYENMYKSLKAEYEQSKVDNDEICKEYDSTIEMLTESVESLKQEKTNLETQISQLQKDQTKLEKEKETLISKNEDKISDIQNLNKQMDKLQSELEKVKEENNSIKDKIIGLEKDNDHYLNKLRQDDEYIKDINNQLESALEENITMQTEFELYKQQTEETLIRKDQEIKDFQNDIANKEKIIQRLNDKRANNIKELKQKLVIPQEMLKQYQRKLTNTMYDPNFKNSIEKIKINEPNKNNKMNNSIILLDKMVTPLSDTNPQYPPKFMEMYRKSVVEDDVNININNLTEQNNNVTTNQETKNSEVPTKDANINDSLLVQNKTSANNINDSNNPILRVSTLKEGSKIIGDLEGMESDETINKEENEEPESASDKKCFEDLVICDEKDFNIIPIKKLMNENKKNRDKKLADNLRNMLVRIQKRKDVLIKNQKNNNMKLAKLGYKLDVKL